jgi:hypothetical protein
VLATQLICRESCGCGNAGAPAAWSIAPGSGR